MKRGLSPTEWQQLREKEHSYIEEAVTTITPFTAITSNALAHLRDEWISWKDDFIRIDIPSEDSCNSFMAFPGNSSRPTEPPIQGRRSSPCAYCKTKGETNQFENFDPSGDGSTSRSELILHREIASPAVDFLEKVFNVYARSEIGVTPEAVTQAARRVLVQQGTDLSNKYAYSVLKRTAPVIYAHYGLSCDDIVQLTTYRRRTAEQVVERTPGVNFENISTTSFLRLLSNEEPATLRELAKEADLTREGVHYRLTNLREEGRVLVENNERGPPAATWSTTGNWKEPFRCDDCSYTTYALNGIRTHKQRWCRSRHKKG